MVRPHRLVVLPLVLASATSAASLVMQVIVEVWWQGVALQSMQRWVQSAVCALSTMRVAASAKNAVCTYTGGMSSHFCQSASHTKLHSSSRICVVPIALGQNETNWKVARDPHTTYQSTKGKR